MGSLRATRGAGGCPTYFHISRHALTVMRGVCVCVLLQGILRTSVTLRCVSICYVSGGQSHRRGAGLVQMADNEWSENSNSYLISLIFFVIICINIMCFLHHSFVSSSHMCLPQPTASFPAPPSSLTLPISFSLHLLLSL